MALHFGGRLRAHLESELKVLATWAGRDDYPQIPPVHPHVPTLQTPESGIKQFKCVFGLASPKDKQITIDQHTASRNCFLHRAVGVENTC